MKLNALANNRLEHSLQVPMLKAVTLPITIDGKRTMFAVYIAVSPFTLGEKIPTDEQVLKVSRVIADAINKGAL